MDIDINTDKKNTETDIEMVFGVGIGMACNTATNR